MRVMSGVQPSGVIHLGNYFGAIHDHIEWQDEAESFFLIADIHALTMSRDGARLRKHTTELAATYLACGLNPKKAALYRQSDVPEVCQLAWILGSVTPTGSLERAVSFKEARQRSQSTDAGLFNYPLLMAADILLIAAETVPVGRDQLPHLEIAREIARRFNRIYGDASGPLVVPHAELSKNPFVPGIDGEKMSKRYKNTIGLLDEPHELADKVRHIVTDSKRKGDPKDPDSCTVFALLALILASDEKEKLAGRYRSGDIDYGEAKELLVERLNDYLQPIRERFNELMTHQQRLERVLRHGADRARAVARETLAKVRELTGLSKSVKNRS